GGSRFPHSGLSETIRPSGSRSASGRFHPRRSIQVEQRALGDMTLRLVTRGDACQSVDSRTQNRWKVLAVLTDGRSLERQSLPVEVQNADARMAGICALQFFE